MQKPASYNFHLQSPARFVHDVCSLSIVHQSAITLSGTGHGLASYRYQFHHTTFAAVQEEYESACLHLFDALDKMEQQLEGQRYLIPYYPGGQAAPSPTLADYRLFTTLIRFDVVYYSLFKTNVRHIRDYPNLQVSRSRSYHVITHLH